MRVILELSDLFPNSVIIYVVDTFLSRKPRGTDSNTHIGDTQIHEI